eukprot:TRINITY_DN8474_c0_g1_i1.p1 TRINITY_DN8474_c0_g1~~TRINITY_DN8474_c0_g1_i1.p1  ORF type:complete len:187 (-),score=29.75 TRINITY_DN8474_c0_g1_i1:54-614(-)
MGNSQTVHIKKEFDDLNKHTHFDSKELKAIYKQFKKESPQGVITRAEFKEVMKQMGVVDGFLQDLIFNMFDYNKDGNVQFPEFVHALSIMTRGTPEEKLEFGFNMYDIDKNGFITKDEMSQVVDSFYKLVGPMVTFSGKRYESSQQLVEDFFEQMDVNGDGKVSFEEYREGAMKNPDMIQGLRLFS